MRVAVGSRQDPSDEALYQVIDGEWVEKVVGLRQILIANHLARFLNQVAFAHRIGIAVIEALFDFGDPALSRFRPDLAFVSEERWPRSRRTPSTDAWPVVPDLAVEVVSPSSSAVEIQTKVDLYLKAGVRLVWVVYLKTPAIHVHDGSPSIRIIPRDGELDGGGVIPGFRLPLSALFEVEEA